MRSAGYGTVSYGREIYSCAAASRERHLRQRVKHITRCRLRLAASRDDRSCDACDGDACYLRLRLGCPLLAG